MAVLESGFLANVAILKKEQKLFVDFHPSPFCQFWEFGATEPLNMPIIRVKRVP